MMYSWLEFRVFRAFLVLLGLTLVSGMLSLRVEAKEDGCFSLRGILAGHPYADFRLPQGVPQLPTDVPYLVLGPRDVPGQPTAWVRSEPITAYELFAIVMERAINHPVITFAEMPKHKLVLGLTPFVTHDIERGLATLIGTNDAPGVARGAPSVMVMLDGFHSNDPRVGFAAPDEGGITARELRIILTNPRYFSSTLWFRGGRQLTATEVEAEFRPYFPSLFLGDNAKIRP